MPFLDLHKQYSSIQSEIFEAVSGVLEEAVFVGGPRVSSFETEFSEFIGVQHCVGVGNGTDALEIAIEALALPPGSKIIVPANSYIASSEAVSRSGHLPVFADVRADTFLIDLEGISEEFLSEARALIAVHLFGQMIDPKQLRWAKEKYQLTVIEDCAQAHGSRFGNEPAGSVGDVSCFSFYPGKTLGAYGDAGMIATDNAAIAKKCRMIANHGRLEKYDHVFEGRNSRLDALQAAVLSVKLRHLPSWRDRREQIAQTYSEYLSHLPGISVPDLANGSVHAWHLYVVQTEKRDGLQEHLRNAGVATGIHYPSSLPMLEAYRNDCAADGTPVANRLAQEILSLPIGEHMNTSDARYVCEVIGEFFEQE